MSRTEPVEILLFARFFAIVCIYHYFQAKTLAAAEALLNTDYMFMRIPKILWDAKSWAIRAGLKPGVPSIKPKKSVPMKSQIKPPEKEHQERPKSEEPKGEMCGVIRTLRIINFYRVIRINTYTVICLIKAQGVIAKSNLMT